MLRIPIVVFATAILAAALGTLVPSEAPEYASHADHIVYAENLEFRDSSSGNPITTIAAGTTVRWNATVPPLGGHHTITHAVKLAGLAPAFDGTVTVDDPDTEDVRENEFAHTFADIGTFPYYCHPHRFARMEGIVIVT